MRKINTRDFHVATRTTSRNINRRIALYLIREHQRISRADLARRMNLTRGMVSVLVYELIAQEAIHEGATGEAARGRKPTFLHIRTHDRLVVAVDVRFTRTYLMLCDFAGRQLAIGIYDTVFSIQKFVKTSTAHVRKLMKRQGLGFIREGIGLGVPGGRSAHRKVFERSGVGVAGCRHSHEAGRGDWTAAHIEISGRASGLAQL
jgi:N-acetylglucosamine repressor